MKRSDRYNNTTKENVTFEQDGNMISCKPYWFRNLQLDNCGFGKTEDEAYQNLKEQL